MKNKTRVFLSIVFPLLLLTSDIGVSRCLASSSNNSRASSETHAIIESLCTITLYPDICYSTLLNVPDINQKLTTKTHAIELAINKTKEIIQANFHTIQKLTVTDTDSLTKISQVALDNCLEMVGEALQELDTVIGHLRMYVYPAKKYVVDDLKTLMSTTITNMETCLDELSYDAACKRLRRSIIGGLNVGMQMCSNALAMINKMTDRDMANNQADLNEEKVMWPEWLSLGGRKLFGLWEDKPDAVVSMDGKGNYTTITEAVEAAPSNSKDRYIIQIMEGVYKENVEIPKKKTNLMFIGDGRDKTIITGNKNVAAGGTTTTTSATVAAVGNGFLARDITFQNTAGPSGGQAVALRVVSDLSAFYRCGMDGYQDTLYVHAKRQFYVNCFIIGTVDFIFGNAAVVFQFCDIQARRPNQGQRNMVTAQGRKDPNQNTGIVIHKCKIEATSDLKEVQENFSSYLGRPWKKHSRTVVMRTLISDVIRAEGWHPWKKDFALDTLYYREYKNTGPGANTSNRVTWKGWAVMKNKFEAIPFTVGSFINGWTWLLSTGFPFWPGW